MTRALLVLVFLAACRSPSSSDRARVTITSCLPINPGATCLCDVVFDGEKSARAARIYACVGEPMFAITERAPIADAQGTPQVVEVRVSPTGDAGTLSCHNLELMTGERFDVALAR
jgi:hypothetical protein